MRRALLVVCLLFLTSCSTVETTGGGNALNTNLANERIQLKVRTGDPQMDALVYEIAYEQFSRVIPLQEKEPYTGTLEVTFASSTQGGFLGSTSSTTHISGSSDGWYTGGRAVGTSVTSGAFLEWQNSTMLAVLRSNEGARLWSADYSYKGGWEMSGFVVNTPEEAARLVAKRLAARFVQDIKR